MKLIKWSMCDDEGWIDKKVETLRKGGHVVEKRKLKNKGFKFGIYYQHRGS